MRDKERPIVNLQRLAAASFVLSIIAAASCGGPLTTACNDYVDALSDAGDRCSGSGYDDTTKKQFVDLCEAIGAAPGAGDFADQLGSCTSAITADACGIADDACELKGSLPDGAPCGVDVQCAGGNCDTTAGAKAPDSDIDCGACATYLPVGAMCSSHGPACDPYVSRCSGDPGTCLAYAKEGEDCTEAPCDPVLLCDSETTTCKPLPAKGDPCTFNCKQPFVCASGTCADPAKEGEPCPSGGECAVGLICNAAQICAQPKRVGVGEACGFVEQEFVDCNEGLECGFTSQKCEEPKVKGSPCTPGMFECGELLACVSGACQVPDFALCGSH
jgi:hypothetical protein